MPSRPESDEALPESPASPDEIPDEISEHELDHVAGGTMQMWAWHEAVRNGNITAARKSCG